MPLAATKSELLKMVDAWQIQSFERNLHDRVTFDCGLPVLNEWLAKRVSQYEKRDLARTYVLVASDSAIVKGYYALSSHTIVYEALSNEQSKGFPSIDIPAVLLGRLAVDTSVQGKRLGEYLLLDAMRRSESLAAHIGIQAIEVHAIDEPAKNFYQRYGFIPLQDDPFHLFLPMHIIRKLRLPKL